MSLRRIVAAGLVAAWGCLGGSAAESHLPTFADVTEQAGIQYKQCFGDDTLSNIVEGTGAGCMFFDYDGDGWLDIYFVNGRWRPDVNDNRGRKYRGKLRNALYHNNHNGTFTDVTDTAGVGGGESFGFACSAADFDGDGDLDLLVLNYGPDVLYRNNGDGTFTDTTAQTGLSDPYWSLAAPWFDYNNDGLLDVYVVNYLEYDAGKFRSFYAAAGYPGPLSYSGQPDTLFRNNGDGTFTDVTKEAGVYNKDGRGMGATVADLNNDGYPDIFVANDAMECNLYLNSGRGTFEDQALEMGAAFGEGGQGVSHMGPVIGDVDRDGWLDIFIPDMGYGCLLLNRKKFFEDRTAPSKLATICGQYTGWGGVLFDYDNDGYLDAFVANGDPHHLYPEESVLARNDRRGIFVDVADRSGPYFRQKFVSRAATCGDFDNDGDVDLLVGNLNDSPRLLRNEGRTGHRWLTVSPKLPNGKTDAIGARVTVTAGKLVQLHDVIPVTGYLSQADPRAHFGLGAADRAETVEIRWPDRTTTRLENVQANQFLKVVQPQGK
jgi:hypothetical protein